MKTFYYNILVVACDEGTYGTNCSFKCSGNCLDGKACDKVNGNCGSCAAGYEELKCENSRLHIIHNFVDKNCKYLYMYIHVLILLYQNC